MATTKATTVLEDIAPYVPYVGGALGIGLNLLGADSQSDAIKAQIEAENRELQRLREAGRGALGEARKTTVDMYSPLTQYASKGAQGMEQSMTVDPLDFRYDKKVRDFLDPSLNFQIDQSTRAIQSGAAANKSLLSGAAQKAISEGARQIGEKGYADAYSRFRDSENFAYGKAKDTRSQEVENKLNELRRSGMLADIGLRGMSGVSGAETNFANSYVDLLGQTRPTSSAGTGTMIQGQTMQNIGGNLLKLAGDMDI